MHQLDRRAHKLLDEAISENALLDTEQVADWLGVSKNWLEIGRIRGWGPRFKKLAPKIVRYHVPDVRDFLEECSRRASDQHASSKAARAVRQAKYAAIKRNGEPARPRGRPRKVNTESETPTAEPKRRERLRPREDEQIEGRSSRKKYSKAFAD